MGRSLAVAHFVQRRRLEADVSWPSVTDPKHLARSEREASDALSTAHSPRTFRSSRRLDERRNDGGQAALAARSRSAGLDVVPEPDSLASRGRAELLISHLARARQEHNDSNDRNDDGPREGKDHQQGARHFLHRSETLMSDTTTLAGDIVRSTILVIDIGGTHVKFGYVIEGRPQSFTHFVPTQGLRDVNPVERLAAETRQAIDLHGASPDIIVCTVPGFLAKDGDLVLHLPNIPELDGYRLKTDLAAQLGVPVVLERDSNLALLGESLAGAAKDAGAVLGIFFGTGIGASLIVDGKPFRGSGWALELGHAPVFGENTEDTALKHPSTEDYASGRALQAIASRHGAPIRDVFEIGRRSAPLGSELDRFVRYQALAVTSAIAALSPETVVLGGGVLDIAGYPKHRLEELIAANAPCAKTGLLLDLRWASVLHGAPQIVREYSASRLVL